MVASHATTSSTRSRRACAACGPITSTSTRLMVRTARRLSRETLRRSTGGRGRKVRYVGCSNIGLARDEGAGGGRPSRLERFISQQIAYSIVGRDAENELVPLSLDQGSASSSGPTRGWPARGRYQRGSTMRSCGPGESRPSPVPPASSMSLTRCGGRGGPRCLAGPGQPRLRPGQAGVTWPSSAPRRTTHLETALGAVISPSWC